MKVSKKSKRDIKRSIAKPRSIIQIEEFDNGYAITYPNHNDEGNITEVVEADLGMGPTSNEDCVKARWLLYGIIEALGLCNYYFDIECHGKHDYTSKEEK